MSECSGRSKRKHYSALLLKTKIKMKSKTDVV